MAGWEPQQSGYLFNGDVVLFSMMIGCVVTFIYVFVCTRRSPRHSLPLLASPRHSSPLLATPRHSSLH